MERYSNCKICGAVMGRNELYSSPWPGACSEKCQKEKERRRKPGVCDICGNTITKKPEGERIYDENFCGEKCLHVWGERMKKSHQDCLEAKIKATGEVHE